MALLSKLVSSDCSTSCTVSPDVDLCTTEFRECANERAAEVVETLMLKNSPVDESVAGDRQQLPAVLIVVGSGTVWKLYTAGKRPQTFGRQIGTEFTMCWLNVTGRSEDCSFRTLDD